MKKFILITILTVLTTVSFADNITTNNNVIILNKPKLNPVCKPMFDYIKATHKQLEKAINANDANQAGTIVIARHNFMKSFVQQHPECKNWKREFMQMMQDK